MPVILEIDAEAIKRLKTALPPGSQTFDSVDSLGVWLEQHEEEYLLLLGPSVPVEQVVNICESLRLVRPAISCVLVRHQVDGEVLARAMSAGVRDVVPLSDLAAVKGASERAEQLFRALRAPRAEANVQAQKKGRVIAIFSPKGGVGKTTVAVNLAVGLAAADPAKTAVLVDLDLAFGDVAITLQLFPSHSIEHAIGGEDGMDYTLIEPLLTRYSDNLVVMAAPSMPDARERVSPALVTRMLRTLQTQFDYIVIDTAPAFDETTLTALDETDETIIVATLDVPTLKNVKVALDTLDMLSIGRGHRHLLLNRADDEVGITADKVESILGMKVASKIATSLDIAAATNAGRPIVATSPDHPSSVAFRKLAAGFTEDPDEALAHVSDASGKKNNADKKKSRFGLRR